MLEDTNSAGGDTVEMKVPSSKAIRGFVLFVSGLGGMVFETVHEHADRPMLIVGFMTMMGVPLILGSDDKKINVKRGLQIMLGSEDDKKDQANDGDI